MKLTKHLAAIALAAAIAINTAYAEPVPSEFTYQGVLEVDGEPVQADADFIIRLFDGATLVTSISRLATPVQDGQFLLELSFSPALFDGTEYDLEFLVRSPAGIGAYTILGSRQPLKTTPYAYHANSANTLLAPATISLDDLAPTLTLEQDGTDNDSKALRATRGLGTRLDSGFIDRVADVESDSTPIGILAAAQNFPIAGILDANSSDFNTAAVLGEIEFDGQSGAYGLWGLNLAFGTAARLATSEFGGDFSGDLRTDGDISRSYSFGSYDLAAPIAYGYINTNGTIASGTPNFSCVWNSTSQRYEIEIDNESYFFSNYVTVATTVASNASIRTSSVSGRLLIYIESTINQADLQAGFQFVTYKPGGAAAVAGQRRAPLMPLGATVTDGVLYPNPGYSEPRTPVIVEPTTENPLKSIID